MKKFIWGIKITNFMAQSSVLRLQNAFWEQKGFNSELQNEEIGILGWEKLIWQLKTAILRMRTPFQETNLGSKRLILGILENKDRILWLKNLHCEG